MRNIIGSQAFLMERSLSVFTFNELRCRLTPVFQRNNVKKAVLFGSYSKGCPTEKSDVDLLVDSGLHGLKFVGLIEDVREALNGIEVDLFDYAHIQPDSQIEREILDTGVLLYEK